MKYGLIVTPANVAARLFAAAILIISGSKILTLHPTGTAPVAFGWLFIVLGSVVAFFANRWLCRLFIVAWFK